MNRRFVTNMFQPVAMIVLSKFHCRINYSFAVRQAAAETGDPLQTTLRTAVTFTGTGLHTGLLVSVSIQPASAEYGIWFCRTDVADRNPLIPARWDAVSNTDLNTRISNDDGVSVSHDRALDGCSRWLRCP